MCLFRKIFLRQHGVGGYGVQWLGVSSLEFNVYTNAVLSHPQLGAVSSDIPAKSSYYIT